MKGIILAGGHGTRLFPLTSYISKQLLPIYDKPMIYYPLSTLMLAGIREVLLISTDQDIQKYKHVLGDGTRFGIQIQYAIQDEPRGIAESFIIGEDFINNETVALILGDNVFYGAELTAKLMKNSDLRDGACIFACQVSNPESFGILEFDSNDNVVNIVEKPTSPISNYAVTGLYFYDSSVTKYAKELSPSDRNELEITDINNIYLKQKKLKIVKLGRGFTWLDTGTVDSLLEASNFVQIIEKRQGIKIACLEEIALNNQWITADDIKKSIENYSINSSYLSYLERLTCK
jgi:glucose-1-phosphate thymidylyltransferase